MNLIEQFEQEQIASLSEGKIFPDFRAGDTVEVTVKIDATRTQLYAGLCIGRKNRGLHSSFRVRKISHNEGVERVFPLYSPNIESIKVVKRGVVRRAKLYYMRDLRGKAARIKEKRTDFK